MSRDSANRGFLARAIAGSNLPPRLGDCCARIIPAEARRIVARAGWLDWDDLCQEALIAVLRARPRWDETRDPGPFMRVCIRNAMLRAVLAGRPAWLVDRLRAINLVTAELSQVHGRQPTVDEIAAAAYLPAPQVREVYAAMALFQPEDVEALVSSSLDPAGAPDVETIETVREVLEAIPVRERTIVQRRIWGGLSHEAIAGELGLTAGNTRLIYFQTLRRLRRLLDPGQDGTAVRPAGGSPPGPPTVCGRGGVA